ncbi:MAG: ABC transporter permease [Pyrinomonadaceae bacterium]|nr:ABC transporter permease [Pyrinomonadaceae bacterium]
MQTLLQDLRYGVRGLSKKPGFTIIAVLSLALGIGANTALFSVVDAVLLKKLPVGQPDQLVLFKSVAGSNFSPGGYNGNSSPDATTGLIARTSFPYQSFVRMREQSAALSEIFAFAGLRQLNVNADGQAEVASGQVVSGNYYAGLGVPAVLGRAITAEDDQTGASPVAVISHGYWQRRFGGDPATVGKQININNVAFNIVGVTPPEFAGTLQVGSSPDVSLPLALEPQVNAGRSRMEGAGVWWVLMMGRLKPGATAEGVRASLEGVFQQSVLEHRAARASQAQPGQKPLPPLEPKDYPRLVVDPGAQGQMETRRYYAPQLYLLFGAVGLVLLIACANVANLLLVRAASRQREIAVRLAVGASRWRLIRQLLTESVLLACLGGALGLLFSLWFKEVLLAVSNWGGARMAALDPGLDWRVLGFTVGLALLTGILFGLAPALRATRIDLTPSLKDSARTSSVASRSLLSKTLIVAQVAMSLLLLIGAGLFLHTLHNLQGVDAGFNRHNLLLFSVDPNLIGYKGERLVNLYQGMFERIEAVPGVRSATFSRETLLSGGASDRDVYLSGADSGTAARPDGNTMVQRVRENYLETMEIPLLLGRNLSAQDDERAPKVVVVNQTFARRFFPNGNPMGKRFGFSSDAAGQVEIVGVAGDTKYTGLREEIRPTIYLPWQQELASVGSMTFEVRTASDPASFVPTMRQAVREVDSSLPLYNITTQVEQSEQSLTMERMFARLLSLFGLIALALAAVGLYGVMAWSVAQRTNEIGIRMALGAQSKDVLQLVIKRGMALAFIGVFVGLVASIALTRLLKSLLFGVSATDPLTFAGVALLLVAVALLACYVPARRATKVDPMIALRYE